MKEYGSKADPKAQINEVRIIKWPSESRKLDSCRAKRIPRILILDGQVPAPVCTDVLEDWVRPPIARSDFAARVDALMNRFGELGPQVDCDDVLRYRDQWLALSPTEAKVLRVLALSFGRVVGREQLMEECWDSKNVGRNALDLHILRLRRRIAAVQLTIETAWGRGYILESDGNARGLSGV